MPKHKVRKYAQRLALTEPSLLVSVEISPLLLVTYAAGLLRRIAFATDPASSMSLQEVPSSLRQFRGRFIERDDVELACLEKAL